MKGNAQTMATTGNSVIEELLLDPEFDLLRPLFYTNPYALRCELALGETWDERMKSARQRARQIYEILFPNGADAITFDYMYDSKDPKEMKRVARILPSSLKKYRHACIKGLRTGDEGDEECESWRRDRILCYSDGIGFDDLAVIDKQIYEEAGVDDGLLPKAYRGLKADISLVSEKNECLMFVYDDRGCDIVFATHEKLREFYPLLRPYFLLYDLEEMELRYNGDED